MSTIAAPSAAQVAAGPEDVVGTTTRELRAKAQPDECYRGLGQNKPFVAPPCTEGVPKVNQAYVWAVTEAGDDIWFGTFANGQCVTRGVVVANPFRNLNQSAPVRTLRGDDFDDAHRN